MGMPFWVVHITMRLPSLLLLAVWWLDGTVVNGLLSRELKKSGSHRDLVTRFNIPTSQIEPHDHTNMECTVLFIETIPSGVYVDPYQLAALRPYGGPDFHLDDDIDLEQPEFLSKEFKLHIYSNLTKLDNSWTCSFSLPVHLRYHAVSSAEFSGIKFVNPEINLRCFDKDSKMNYHVYKGQSVREKQALCGSNSNWLCEWTQLYVESDTKELQADMPVGRDEHFLIVTMGTIIATVSGCVFLIYKTIYSNAEYKIS